MWTKNRRKYKTKVPPIPFTHLFFNHFLRLDLPCILHHNVHAQGNIHVLTHSFMHEMMIIWWEFWNGVFHYCYCIVVYFFPETLVRSGTSHTYPFHKKDKTSDLANKMYRQTLQTSFMHKKRQETRGNPRKWTKLIPVTLHIFQVVAFSQRTPTKIGTLFSISLSCLKTSNQVSQIISFFFGVIAL